jgi:hypothetical protein
MTGAPPNAAVQDARTSDPLEDARIELQAWASGPAAAVRQWRRRLACAEPQVGPERVSGLWRGPTKWAAHSGRDLRSRRAPQLRAARPSPGGWRRPARTATSHLTREAPARGPKSCSQRDRAIRPIVRVTDVSSSCACSAGRATAARQPSERQQQAATPPETGSRLSVSSYRTMRERGRRRQRTASRDRRRLRDTTTRRHWRRLMTQRPQPP